MKKSLSVILLASMAFTACSKKKVNDDVEISEDVATVDGASDQFAVGSRIAEIGVVNFEYDSFGLTGTAQEVLNMGAEWLLTNPTIRVQIEGHSDERGTTEYNLALGERRAGTVKDYLVSRGVPADRLSTISYGEERPAVPGFDEKTWAQNRRAEFVAAGI